MLRRLSPVVMRLGWLATLAGSLFIAVGTTVYFDDELPPFLLEKLPLPHESLWLGAVQLHVVSTAFALPACLVLSLAVVLRRAPRLHRWLGRMTGAVILLASVPSGFYLALYAKGGLVSTLGFMLSGLIVAVAMMRAIVTARRGNLVAHRHATRHVLAQLSVAVTSRSLLVAFAAFGIDDTVGYVIALWLPVVVSALAVEFIEPRSLLFPLRSHHAPRTRPVVPHARHA